MNAPFPAEPPLTRGLRLLWRASGQRPRVDNFLTGALRYRHYLPRLTAAEAIPGFERTEVRLTHCPVGAWSTPLVDVLLILKCAVGFNAKNILELGSFRGETARLLAENTADDARVCAVDIDERHGSAYAGTPAARKVRRITGNIEHGLFRPDEKFDLIFVDAAHDFDSVLHDSALAFEWLAADGVLLWHDYRPGGNYFAGGDNVAEALAVCAKEHPIAVLENSSLAMHSRRPGWETATLVARKSAAPASPASPAPVVVSPYDHVWKDTNLRQ